MEKIKKIQIPKLDIFKIPKFPKFRQKKRSEEQENKEKENQIIAVWGSPNSGKTITSIKMAKELANNNKNVIVVHDDTFCPSIPLIFPTLEEREKSIGKVLVAPNIDQNIILENCITPIKNNDHIAFLGYIKGENPLTYAEYTKERAVDLLILLRHLADYIIVDCSSITTESILTITALEIADKVIRLSAADFKGLSYFQSTLPLLMDDKFKTEEHLKIVSNVKDYQDADTINSVIKGSGIYLRHVEEIERQYTEACLFKDLNTKEGKDYEKMIIKIIQEMISVGIE